MLRICSRVLTTLSVRVPVLSKQMMVTLAAMRSALEYSSEMPALSKRIRAMCVSTKKMVGMLGGTAWVRVSKKRQIQVFGVWGRAVAARPAKEMKLTMFKQKAKKYRVKVSCMQ